MSDVEWDADDFNADVAVEVKSNDKWEGEDEDDDCKDNWDDEEEEGKENEDGNKSDAPLKKKKKNLKDIIAEKEEKKRKEIEERRKQEEEARKKLTPEELVAEKLRQQKIQEDADLELARDAFGIESNAAAAPAGKIDSFEPLLKEDFDKFGEMLEEKITVFNRSTFYVDFLEQLYRNLSVGLEVDDVKRLSSSMTALYNEKNKAQKAKSKKKGKPKQSVNAGRDDNYDDYTTGAFDDLDDFM